MFVVVSSGVLAQPAPPELPTDPPLVPTFDIRAFKIEGNTVLPADVAAASVAPFSGARRDFGHVQQAIEALEETYKKRGYSSVAVLLPEQVLESGTVTLRVVEAKIRKIDTEGNTYFSRDNILASLPTLQVGKLPVMDAISPALRVANENPAKKITLQLSPGENEDDIDARIKVTDESPWKLGLSLDNTGSKQTGQSRLGISYQHSNLLNRDHILTFQYQTSPEKPSDVNVLALAYRIPFYLIGDVLDVYASKSDVNSGFIAAGPFNLAITGRGQSYGAKYTFKLKRQGDYDHELVLGLDSKLFENSIAADALELGNNLEVHPLSVQYSGRIIKEGSEFTANLSAVHNIPGGKEGKQADFDKARVGSQASYTVVRGGVTYSQTLPADWQSRAVLTAQLANRPLIPGEQFGVGGATSVRGYEEREVASDKGVQGNLELYTPEFCARWIASSQCRGVLFYDWAVLNRNNPLPSETASNTVSSVGAGLRWTLGKDTAAQVDVANVRQAGGSKLPGDWKLHGRLGVFF